MASPGTLGQTVLRLGLLLMVMLLTACSGFEPYEPRNDRVEGPERGLFSGESGEFVIYEKTEEIDPGDEEDKNENSTD